MLGVRELSCGGEEGQMNPSLWRNREQVSYHKDDFIECYQDFGTGGIRLRGSGAMRHAGPRTREQLEAVINSNMRISGISETFRRNICRNMHESHRAGINLEQAARDKVYPIFWAALTGYGGRYESYTKENAKQSIDGFRAAMELSRSDWAWLCNKSPTYLYYLFQTSIPNIRWPERLLMAMRDRGFPSILPPVRAWLKKYFLSLPEGFIEAHPIDEREFAYVMGDLYDLFQQNPDALKNILAQKDWGSFINALRSREGGYGTSPAQIAMPQIAHLLSLSNHVLEGIQFDHSNFLSLNRPFFYQGAISTKLYEHLANLTKFFTNDDGFTATLIPNEESLFNEGRDMKHCIWRSYRNRVGESKDYIAYHIDAPHLANEGFTLGLKLISGIRYSMSPPQWRQLPELIPPTFAITNDKMWNIDQIRGISNAIPHDGKLDAFAGMICRDVNERLKV